MMDLVRLKIWWHEAVTGHEVSIYHRKGKPHLAGCHTCNECIWHSNMEPQ